MDQKPEWSVEFYVDARGNRPVLEFLGSLARADRAKVARALALLREFGPALRMPHVRRIGELGEIRAGAIRVFYFLQPGRRFVILHGFRKKTQRTPRKEIAIARRRLRDFFERQGDERGDS